MKTNGNIWVFFNAETGKQTKPMALSQAQMALLGLKSGSLCKIYLWTPGWENWQKLDSFLSTNQKFFVLTNPNEEITALIPEDTFTETVDLNETSSYTQVEFTENQQPAGNQDYGYFAPDFTGDDLDLSKIRKLPKIQISVPHNQALNEKSKRRASIRHDFKIEIVLISKERSFRTYSRNISLGGTLLEDEIPKDFLNRPFDLIIINRFEKDTTKGRLLFKAKIIGDISNPRRLMFTNTAPEMMERLDLLLKAYINSQSKDKKPA